MAKTVTLYIIDDDGGKGSPQVKNVLAREFRCFAKNFVVPFDSTYMWFDHCSQFVKDSPLVCLTPQEALVVYMEQQEEQIQAGERATIRLTMAQVLLWKLENETSEEPKSVR